MKGIEILVVETVITATAATFPKHEQPDDRDQEQQEFKAPVSAVRGQTEDPFNKIHLLLLQSTSFLGVADSNNASNSHFPRPAIARAGAQQTARLVQYQIADDDVG
jgi:hypothetical protein